MNRHIIIDGYNLLGARGGLRSVSEPVREGLLHELALYRQRTGHSMTVVFDGWQRGLGVEHHEHRAGMTVVYSRRGERADQVIQRLAEDLGQDCAVVSSDQDVSRFARAHGALTMSASAFQAKLAPPAAPETRGVGFHKPDEAAVPSRRDLKKKGNPRRLPKAQRRRNRQLRRF